MALNVGDAYISLMLDRAPLTKAMAGGEKDVQAWGNTVEKEVEKAGGHFSKLGSIMSGVFTGVGMAAATKGLELVSGAMGQVKNSVIGTNATLQDSNTAWKTLLGTQQAATDQMKKLKDFANTTPFEFGEVDRSAKNMATFGISVNDTTKYLKLFGDAAAGTNQGMEDVTFWSSRMYDAIKSGKPFGEASARLQEMGVMSGVTRAKLEGLQASGASGDEVWAAYSDSLGRFSGLMGEQAKNWNGLTSTIGDSVNFLLATAGKPIFDKLSLGAGKLVDILGSDKINTFAETFGNQIAAGIDKAFNAVGRLIDGGKRMYDAFKAGEKAAKDLIAAFTSGDFNSAFGPILKTIDLAFGDGAAAKSALFVSKLLSGFQSIRDTVKTVGDAWSGNWQDSDKISSPFVRAAGNVTQLFRDAKTTAQQAWSGNWQDSDQISNPWVRGVGVITKLIADIGPTFDTVKEKIGTVKDTLSGMFSNVTSGGAGGIAALILGPDAGAKVTSALTSISDQLGPIINLIKGANYGDMFASLVSSTQSLGQQIAPLGESVKNLYLAFAPMGAIIGPLTGQFNVWASLAETLGPILTNSLGAALIGVQGALTPLGDLFSQLGTVVSQQGPAFADIGGKLMELWTALTPVFQAAGAVIGVVLVGAVGLLVANIGGLVGMLSGALPGVLNVASGLIDVLTGNVNFLVDMFKGGVAVIGALLRGDFPGAMDAARGAGEKLRADFGQIWSGIRDTAIGVFQAMIGGVTGLVDGFVNTISGYFTSIYNKITGESITPMKINVIQSFTDMISTVGTAVGTWFSDLGTKADGFRDRAVTTFTDFRDKVQALIMAPFTGARDAIGGVMEGFRSAMVGPLSAGLGSMGKFGNGIRDVINWVARALHIPEIPGGPAIPELAKGTKDFQGGPAVVGEEGPELVWMPKHAIVIPHAMSEKLIASGMVPGFADGLNLPSLFDMVRNGPQWLLDKAINAVGLKAPELPGFLNQGAGQFFASVKQWMADAVIGFVKKALPVTPGQIQDMIQFAESQIGLPYIWGGGHGGGLGGPGVGFDCSGFVASVLDKGGISNPHGIVTDFYNWMKQDGGNGVVDIGVSNPFAAPDIQHTGIRLLGSTYESGGPFGGVGKNGTAFESWGSPPDFNPQALGGLTSGRGVDWEKSLQNMKRGIRGQWTAMAGGGIVNETVMGIGADSGTKYLLGEAGKEFIIPESMIPQILAYFTEVLATGELSNSSLIGIPLEMRDGLKKVAAKYLASMPDKMKNPAKLPIPTKIKNPGGIPLQPRAPSVGGGVAEVYGNAGGKGPSILDPTSPDYIGPVGTGAYDQELAGFLDDPTAAINKEWLPRAALVRMARDYKKTQQAADAVGSPATGNTGGSTSGPGAHTSATAGGGDALTQIAGDVRAIRDFLIKTTTEQVGPATVPGSATNAGIGAALIAAINAVSPDKVNLPEQIANPNPVKRGNAEEIPNPNPVKRGNAEEIPNPNPVRRGLPEQIHNPDDAFPEQVANPFGMTHQAARSVIATETRIILQMPDGELIATTIRSSDVAIKDLADGVTLVQAQEMAKIAQH